MKTQAAVLRGTDIVRVEELTLPELKPGQVLVKVLYSGICGTQLMELRGKRGEDEHLPHLLGHEGSGSVVQSRSPLFDEGDMVTLSWIPHVGMGVLPGPYTDEQGLEVNSGFVATLTQYAVVTENRCKRTVHDPMIAALFGCAIPTGASAITKGLRPLPGSTICIVGAGGVGIAAAITAKNMGCHVVMVDKNKTKLDWARAILGVSIEEPFNGSFRLVLEATGTSMGMQKALDLTAKDGHMVITGNLPHGQTFNIDPYELIFGKKVSGIAGSHSFPDFIQEMSWKSLVSYVGSLSDVDSLFKRLESGTETGRILVKMSH